MIRRCLLVAIILLTPALVFGASSASRSSGVAPLAVHFIADVVASTPSAQHFHDRLYSWNFGDEDAGNWGTTGLPKNTDTGPITNHVYATAGTYTATLTVRDATGVLDTDTFEITVSDPDTVFETTKTTCVSTGTDWTGCPSGAAHVTTSSLAGLSGYTDAGERVLLRRGDSWTVATRPSWPENNGPVHIGAYGTCTSPDAQGICTNAPVITFTSSDGEGFLPLSHRSDWRLADLAFSAAVGTGYVTSTYLWAFNHLIYHIKTTGFESPLYMSSWRNSDADYIEHMAFIENHASGSYSWPAYVGGEKLAVMGNILSDTEDGHVLRVWLGYKAVISHNIAHTTLAGKHTLKFFGPTSDPSDEGGAVGNYATTGQTGMRYRTEMAVISNNVFGGSGIYPVSVGPEDEVSVENLSDIIFEKNKVIANYGIHVANTQVLGVFEGRYFTIRNNVFDQTSGDEWCRSIWITQRGEEWTPLSNRVYNNTIYSNTNHTSGESIGVEVNAVADDTIVRNNLVSFPNTTTYDTLLNSAGGETTASNNAATDTAHLADPTNANPLLRDYSLTSSSTSAIDQGYTVPVFDDFAGDSRIGITYDIGADEYESGGDPPTEISFATGVISGGVIR